MQPAIGSNASSEPRPAAADRLRLLLAAGLPIAAVVGCLVSIWFGLSTLAVTLPDVVNAFPAAPYALDGSRHLAVASVVAAGGGPYSVAGYLYPPPGALVMLPFTALGPEAGLWAWFALKVGIALWCVIDATRGRPALVRLLAIVFVATLLGVMDDLWLGNVSIIMAASIYLAVSRESPWAAVPLGLVIGALAKPFLVPFLLWMVVYRRAGALVAIGTAAALSVVAFVVMGPASYRSYLDALTAATGMDLSYSQGLAGIAPGLLVPLSIAALVGFAALLFVSRDESSLLLWSLLVGLVAAPYVTQYAVVPVLAGIPLFARSHPTRTLVLAALVAPLVPVAVMAATGLGLVIAFPIDVLHRIRSRSGAAPLPARRAPADPAA